MMWARLIRWRWGLGLAALLLAALAYAFWPEPRLVDIGKVSKGPMFVGVTDDGVTREKELYVVSAPVSGFAERINLEAGDRVARGQLITWMAGAPTAPLDRRTEAQLRGSLAAAQANARQAAAVLDQARRDLARAEELGRSGFVSRANLETARTRVATGEAALDQSRGELERTQAALARPGQSARGPRVPVVAPVGGAVLVIPNRSEGLVAEGTPLVTIGDPGQIEIVVDLLSRDAVQVAPGDRVEITQWGGARPLIGHVDYVEPYGRLKVSALGIEEQRVNVIVGLDPAAAREAVRLGHGYQLDATIILWSKPDALRAPIGALFRGGDGKWRVFAVEDGRARERIVRIGHLNDEYAEVLAGLAQGAVVVLNPANDLRVGMRIRPR